MFGKKLNTLETEDAAVKALWAQLNYLQETIEARDRVLNEEIKSLEARVTALGG